MIDHLIQSGASRLLLAGIATGIVATAGVVRASGPNDRAAQTAGDGITSSLPISGVVWESAPGFVGWGEVAESGLLGSPMRYVLTGTAVTPMSGARSAGSEGSPSASSSAQEEAQYDGSYNFVRVQFDAGGGGSLRGFGGGGRGREPDWAHDWPRADRHFLEILNELTFVAPTPGIGKVLRMDDPEIFRFPVSYLVEIGSWRPSQVELTALGDYLNKGGFLILDDFRDGQFYNFQEIMARAMPGSLIMEVPIDHAIFDSFFRIEDPYALAPPYGRSPPIYYGIFEDNDPYGRLMGIFNYNQDHGEYWETSGQGWYLIDIENEAFKFGVNYVIYSMTH